MLVCTITSPANTETYKNLKSVTLPAFSGHAQILPGHAESFLILKKGDISLKQENDQNKKIQIDGGECHIKNDTIAVIL